MKITSVYGYLNNESGELYLKGCSRDLILEIVDRCNTLYHGPTYGEALAYGAVHCYGDGGGAYRWNIMPEANACGEGNSSGFYDGRGGAL
jgi:hypothetical protein